jgi:hypothetical protein
MRLPRPYTEDSHLIEEPFVFKLTKVRRTTLQEIQKDPKLFHLQDTVLYYEAITNFPIEYNNLPEPVYTEIKHIRDLSNPERRKVFWTKNYISAGVLILLYKSRAPGT